MTPRALPEPGLLSTLRVPLLAGGIMAACLASTGALIFMAERDRTFAVEPNYYAKALAWDRDHQAALRSRALGWNALARAQGEELVVTLTDREGRPVKGAVVGAEVFASIRAAVRTHLALTESSAGEYRTVLPAGPSGLWRVNLTAQHEEDRFVAALTVFCPRQAGAEGRGVSP